MLRHASDTLHVLVEALLGLIGIAALAGCALAWRLSEGPIDITWLARREQHYLAARGAQLEIGSAALAWEGFVDPGSAIDIRWRDVTVTAKDGAVLARLPQGRVALSASRLVIGRVAPSVVEVDGAAIALLRRMDGSVTLDLGQSGAASPKTFSRGAPTSGAGGSQRLLRDLTDTGPNATLPFLSQLDSIHVRDATMEVRDAALGALWRAREAVIDLERTGSGGIEGHALLPLEVGATRATLRVDAAMKTGGTQVTAALTPISLASLAQAVPVLAQGAAFEPPVQATLTADLGSDFAVRHAVLGLEAGPGTVRAGSGAVALRHASAAVALDGEVVRVDRAKVEFEPAPGAHLPPPTVTGSATMRRAGGRLRADFAVAVDRVSFADLRSYWPLGTGGGARPWITTNITAGSADNAHVTGTVEADAALSDVTVIALAGGLEGDDLVATWLKPVPGLVRGRARLTLQGPDALLIEVPQAEQLVPPPDAATAHDAGKAARGTLAVSRTTIGITGLMQKDQIGKIDLKADGALPDVLALLNVKRLGLLSKRPISMRDPAGRVAMTLSVRLPLDDRITFNDVGIEGSAHMTGVHLGSVVAGRDLDHGVLDLHVDADSLHMTGNAEVAAIPAQLGVDMDFRVGPPRQVLEHFSGRGTATPAALVAAGLPPDVLTGGTAAVDVDYADRRDGSGTVAIDLDLAKAAIGTPFGWSKSAGPPAAASARLGLTQGRITSIDRLRASGPNLAIASHAQLRAGQGTVLALDQVRLGRTEARGSIGLPSQAGDPLRVVLRGPNLDISPLLSRRGGSKAEDDGKPGRRWSADLAFDHVILAKDEVLSPVVLQASSDGIHIARAMVRAGGAGEIRASITPVAGGRTLSIDSADAGAVLLAAGVADNIRGGKLDVGGFYADTLPHSPLKGTATLAGFRITDAPAVGRLLKAMTLYGAVDLLRGPGLGFQKAVVPFSYERQVLTLDRVRAFSASLGITAKGTIDLVKRVADVTGTIVPAYFFNQLPGRIPLIGKLFSPEEGGGVFAARYSVRGGLDNPKVGVNPLAALTPGFLRGIFGFFASGQQKQAQP